MSLKQIVVSEFGAYHVFTVLQEGEVVDTLFFNQSELNYNSVCYVNLEASRLLSINSFYAKNQAINNSLVVNYKNQGLQKSLLCTCFKLPAGEDKTALLRQGLVLDGYFLSLKSATTGLQALTYKGFLKQDLSFNVANMLANNTNFTVELNKNCIFASYEQILCEYNYLHNLANSILQNKQNILLLQQNPLLKLLSNHFNECNKIVFENNALKSMYFCPLAKNAVNLSVAINELHCLHVNSLFIKNEILALAEKNVLQEKDLTIKLHETEDFSYFDLNGNASNPLKFNLNAIKVVKNIIYKRAISGQILVDLVKIKLKDDKILLLKQAREIFANNSDIKLEGITKLGILEISRKRTLRSVKGVFAKQENTTLTNNAIALICQNEIMYILKQNPIAMVNCFVCSEIYGLINGFFKDNESILSQIKFTVSEDYKNGKFKVFAGQ